MKEIKRGLFRFAMKAFPLSSVIRLRNKFNFIHTRFSLFQTSCSKFTNMLQTVNKQCLVYLQTETFSACF